MKVRTWCGSTVEVSDLGTAWRVALGWLRHVLARSCRCGRVRAPLCCRSCGARWNGAYYEHPDL